MTTGETETMDAFKTPLIVVARILLALMFILAGLQKFGNLGGTAGYIASGGLPAPMVLAVIVAALEVVGGVLLVIGYQARYAALALGLFTLAASVLFHNYWAMPADKAYVQQLMFMKNMAVAGGMFVVAALGAGPASLDAKRQAAA